MKRLPILLAAAAIGGVAGILWVRRRWEASSPAPDPAPADGAIAEELRRHVEALADGIGERRIGAPGTMEAAADYLDQQFAQAGYQVRRQQYHVDGEAVDNLEAELPGSGRKDEILVIGAHYDTIPDCPGANDNATGAAAVLSLARQFAAETPARTIRFVCFANEEPPYFQTESMGSRVYARECRQNGDRVVGMLSLETMGCYSDEPGSQDYPSPIGWLYPTTGNFIAFVSNLHSRGFLQTVVDSFRRQTSFPVETAALPGSVTGVGWSDHWSFWQEGYPALMVTDTAPFRFQYYHTPEDTPEKNDYIRLAQVVSALAGVIRELASP